MQPAYYEDFKEIKKKVLSGFIWLLKDIEELDLN